MLRQKLILKQLDRVFQEWGIIKIKPLHDTPNIRAISFTVHVFTFACINDVRGLMTQYRDNDTTINSSYNENGWMTSTNQIQGSSNTTTTYSNFDAMGNAWHQRLDYDGGYDALNQSYVGYDSLCAYDLVGTRYNKYGAGPASSVSMRYGANGSLSGICGIYNDLNEQDKDAIPETLIVVSDYSGLTYGRRLLPVGVNGN